MDLFIIWKYEVQNFLKKLYFDYVSWRKEVIEGHDHSSYEWTLHREEDSKRISNKKHNYN